jgi:hypothetical protein
MVSREPPVTPPKITVNATQVSPELYEGKTGHRLQVNNDPVKTKELERQRIERELQRQRMHAISGKIPQKKEPAVQVQKTQTPHLEETKTIIRRSTQPKKEYAAADATDNVGTGSGENRILVKTKRKPVLTEEPEMPGNDPEPVAVPEEIQETVSIQREYPDTRESADRKIGIKDTIRRANDDSLEGKGISMKVQPRVNDDALLHSRLKPQKSLGGAIGASHAGSSERSSKIKQKQDTGEPDDADQS